MADLILSLATQHDYLSSLALIRQKITLGREAHDLPTVLRLRVALPYENRVDVFMQASNLYLIGFRGATKVYALDADTTTPAEKYDTMIRESGRLETGETVAEVGQRGDHGALGTFDRPFGHGDLSACSVLSIYRDGQPYSAIKRPFALLVCMLAEGTRFLQVQNDFAGVRRTPGNYSAGPVPGGGVWGDNVEASEVVNYWSNATHARSVAERHGLGVTEGHRRASEFKQGVVILEAALGAAGASATPPEIYDWMAGAGAGAARLRTHEGLPAVASTLARLRLLAQQTKLRTGTEIAEFTAALQNEIAVKASLGLLVPAV